MIGGGAAGLTAAGMSALLGAKTLLIERDRLGGECTWTGCIPSKALLATAKSVHNMKTADRFGLRPVTPQVSFADVINHVHQLRHNIYQEADAPPQIEKLGVEVAIAQASFLNPHTVELQTRSGPPTRVTARFFVIATGSRPKLPGFELPCLTNETIFELSTLPPRLLVLGAGPVGIEMAQALQRLGSQVTVVSPGSGILLKEDPEHAATLQSALSEEGVVFFPKTKVASVENNQGSYRATLNSGESVISDAILAAIGRSPAIQSLRLENAGVATNSHGIAINKRCQTSQRHIYAAGDVTGKYQYTHMAEHMSKVAVTNAILRIPKSLDTNNVSWSTFTDPELAHLGESENDLRHRHAKYRICRFPFSKLDRAIVDRNTIGEVKVFTTTQGKILGASILGSNAGEMIAEYALAMRNRLSIQKVADTIHAYPTYALGNRRAADQHSFRQLDSPFLGLWAKLLRYRGKRKGSRVL